MLQSPPSRRRGLKLESVKNYFNRAESPPSRRRGLKFTKKPSNWDQKYVASFSEAWIEISRYLHFI